MKVYAAMDRVEIELPSLLRSSTWLLAFSVLYILLCVFSLPLLAEAMFYIAMGGQFGRAIADSAIFILGAAASLAFALPIVYGLAIRWLRRAKPKAVRTANGVFAAILVLSCLSLGLAGLGWTTIAVAATLYALVTAFVSWKKPRVILDGARVQIQGRREVHRFNLEDIRSIARDKGLLQRVRINGEPVSALRHLSEAEEGWLKALILQTSRDRREALARQGHDLAAPPAPPAALLARLKRQPS